ncbi:MAG: UDP-N-acetylmuramoyl-L-alanine--D-glutamate ligase [Rhodospirillales bacterium]
MIQLAAMSGSPVAVLGLGRSGMATVRALRAGGHRYWAWDDDAAVRATAAAEGVVLTDLHRHAFEGATPLVLSPGIPHTHPAPHPVVARARAAGCEVVGDCELLARARPEAAFVGITGTNGKSTTTALVGHILRSAGRDCEVGGNLGPPVLAFRPLGADGFYVLEMSSYQLELIRSLVFRVAVLLNITPDHIDRHGGFDGYVAAKRRIFRGQGRKATAIVAVDDEPCRAIVAALRAQGEPRVIPISGSSTVAGGVFALDGTLYDDIDGGGARPLVDLATARALPGEHNAQNAAAAFASVRALGVDAATAAAALLTFPGLAHRQEVVAAVDGVVYVNDSKATNPEAAARALACYRDIYWIAGGRPKEGPLTALEPYLDRVRHAFLIGEATEGFAAALEHRVPISRCGTLGAALVAARAAAEREGRQGAVVLLSPACASFDQFRNFEERGETFRRLVAALRQC